MSGSNIFDLLGSLAWPAAFVGFGLFYKDKLSKLVDAFSSKFETATEIKLGSVELKGPVMDTATNSFRNPETNVPIDGNDYSKTVASVDEEKVRNAIYNNTKGLC